MTCALGPYNFEFMDAGPSRDRHAVPRGRHLRESLGAAGRRLLLRALPGEFPPRRPDWTLPGSSEPARPAPPRVPRMAKGAAHRAVAALGRHRARGEPRRAVHAERPAGHQDRRRSRGHPVRRLPGAAWPDAAVGERPARQGIPLRHGPQARSAGIFSVGVEEPYRWKDSVQSEPEVQLWVAEGTANGMRPWVTKFSGVLYDRRWLPVVQRIYQWHFEHERYLRNEAPLARVALLYSEQTAAYHTRCRRRRSSRRSRARDVSRARRSASAVRDGRTKRGLTPERLAAFRLLILADAAALSSTQCAAIRPSWPAAAACWRPSRRRSSTRRVRRRKDFGLADLFGVSFTGRIDGPMQNSYLSLDADPANGRRHEVLDGLDGTSANHQRRLPHRRGADRAVSVAGHAHPVVSRSCRWRTSIRACRTRRRASSTCVSSGRSRIVYVPWDIDRDVLGRARARPRTAARKSRAMDGERAARRSRSRGQASWTSRSGGSGPRSRCTS